MRRKKDRLSYVLLPGNLVWNSGRTDISVEFLSMLRFDEIATLRDHDIRAVYRELTPSTLAMALTNAPPEVADKFFRNMRFDMAEMIRETMKKLGVLSDEQIKTGRDQVLKTIELLRSQHKIGQGPEKK